MPNKKTVFIDGQAGTTGLSIYRRLSSRPQIELLTLPEALRKDQQARRQMLNTADIVILCLPDEAAIEAEVLIENPDTVVLDTSTAHRTADGWTYGFPELFADGAQKIAQAKRIAVPGCHASGFLALTAPLTQAGLLPKNALLTCHSVTGYSGGGIKMIEAYEAPARAPLLGAPRQYALEQRHKHLREMRRYAGLSSDPIFCPVIGAFYSGMAVTVPLFSAQLTPGKTFDDVRAVYAGRYPGPVVRYTPAADDAGFYSASALSGTDRMEISVFGNEERMLLCARFDNLGKGACGAALQCLALVLGHDPATFLDL